MATPKNKQLKKLIPSKIPRAISPMAKPTNLLKHYSCDEDIPKSKPFQRHQFRSLRLPTPRTPPAINSPRTPPVTSKNKSQKTNTPSSPHISNTATTLKQKILRFCHLAKPSPPPKPKHPAIVKTPSKVSQKVDKFEKDLENVILNTERAKEALGVQNELITKYMWQISELKEIVQYLNAEVYVLKAQQDEFEKKGLSVNAESVNKLCEFLKDLRINEVCDIGGLEEDTKNCTWGYFQGFENNKSLCRSVL